MIFDNRMERREEKVRKDRKRRTKVSAMGRLTREMMSDVMETALKKRKAISAVPIAPAPIITRIFPEILGASDITTICS